MHAVFQNSLRWPEPEFACYSVVLNTSIHSLQRLIATTWLQDSKMLSHYPSGTSERAILCLLLSRTSYSDQLRLFGEKLKYQNMLPFVKIEKYVSGQEVLK